MSDETNTMPETLAPAPAPAPETPAPVPPVVTSTGGLSDEDAFKAAADPSVPAPPAPEPEIEAAPGETTPAPKKAKFPFYKELSTGDMYPALRTPAGYEDGHPSLYEGVSELPKATKSE